MKCALLSTAILFLVLSYLYGEIDYKDPFPQARKKAMVLPHIYEVDDFAVDDTQVYVTQRFIVHIYSLSDYKPVGKFGTRGAGPCEFRGFVRVVPRKGRLIISSSGKISFYSRQGEYLKEIKAPSLKNGIFIPIKDGFVGHGFTPIEKGTFYRTIDHYNSQLQKIKEIFKYGDSSLSKGKGPVKFNLMETKTRTFRVENDKILVGRSDGSIEVFDKDAGLVATIKGQYEKLIFTQKHRQTLIENFLLANPGKSGSYNRWKTMLEFPTHFPPIQLFQTSERKVYVLTHKRENQRGECFVYNLSGKLLKHTMIPIFDFSPKAPYPLAFYKGKLYQVCENEDTEEWELHITTIL